MNKLKIILKKSLIGRNKRQIRNIYSLGLKKINQKVIKDDNFINRGILAKIHHLVSIQKIIVSKED
ncbi:50S ribosomal protein L30 [Candidatus Phytoplasma oryzae]|uniref:50S ribosomal protein L30 n=1 Tax=Candidatus Phytoplasma oryzae TaxID=203274 RepID=A0A328ILR6_9MOLU|nr:50S ribosomal protein L30 [Candidatus Phytoplasma oryzae]RAM57768.1 50S ribosomal protein L30 [Candidatus Phytoplasma oryzae]